MNWPAVIVIAVSIASIVLSLRTRAELRRIGNHLAVTRRRIEAAEIRTKAALQRIEYQQKWRP